MTLLEKFKVASWRQKKAVTQTIIEQLDYNHKDDEEVLAELIAAEEDSDIGLSGEEEFLAKDGELATDEDRALEIIH